METPGDTTLSPYELGWRQGCLLSSPSIKVLWNTTDPASTDFSSIGERDPESEDRFVVVSPRL